MFSAIKLEMNEVSEALNWRSDFNMRKNVDQTQNAYTDYLFLTLLFLTQDEFETPIYLVLVFYKRSNYLYCAFFSACIRAIVSLRNKSSAIEPCCCAGSLW